MQLQIARAEQKQQAREDRIALRKQRAKEKLAKQQELKARNLARRDQQKQPAQLVAINP
jgi:hypothetical protein